MEERYHRTSVRVQEMSAVLEDEVDMRLPELIPDWVH